MRFVTVVILTLVATASPAVARPLTPEDIGRLEAGKVLVDLKPERDHADHVWAVEDIAAAPDTVWAVMTDCGQALHYVPRLRACQILEADPQGRWDVRRHELSSIPWLPNVKATFRLDYDRPRTMRFQQISGDMQGSMGEWRLLALDGGRRTRVVYEARLRAPALVPNPFVQDLIRRDAPSAMEGLRRLSQARVGRSAH